MTGQRTKVWSEDQLRCLLDIMLVKLPDSLLLEGGRLVDSHVDARVYFVLFTLLPSLTLGPTLRCAFAFTVSVLVFCVGVCDCVGSTPYYPGLCVQRMHSACMCANMYKNTHTRLHSTADDPAAKSAFLHLLRCHISGLLGLQPKHNHRAQIIRARFKSLCKGTSM